MINTIPVRYFLYTLLITMFLIYSCANTETEIFQKEIKDVNLIKIYFYDSITGKINDTGKIITLERKEDIEKFKDIFTNESTPRYKCGYTGLIEYFKDNKTIKSMEFNLTPECGHIVFTLRGRAFSKKLSDNGLSLLQKEFNKVNL